MEIEVGKNSQFFVEITIRTRPPIYVYIYFKIKILVWVRDRGLNQLLASIRITITLKITSIYIYVCYNYHKPPSAQTIKLDGVGPVDNRPSTDKLHKIVTKKIKKNCDT